MATIGVHFRNRLLVVCIEVIFLAYPLTTSIDFIRWLVTSEVSEVGVPLVHSGVTINRLT